MGLPNATAFGYWIPTFFDPAPLQVTILVVNE